MSSPVLDVLNNRHCSSCPLFKSVDHITVRNQTVRINSRYFPEGRIRLLLVAESPPMAFLENSISYFYAPGRITDSRLAFYTMHALYERKFTSKEQFLGEFVKENYLVDMAKCPINRLRTQEERAAKKKALIACAEYLKEELSSIVCQKVVFIGKKSFETIRDKLNLERLDYIVIPLPYNSKKNVESYRTGLRKAMRALEK